MKKSVAFVVLVLLVLSACGPRTTEPAQPVDFRSGSQGLALSFLPNMPPPRLFDRDPFNVMIQVENRGTSTIGTVGGDRIYLSGFDQSIITGINNYGESIPELEGRSAYVPQGGFDTVSFKGTIASLVGKRIDKYTPTILATACYNYETVASAQVCIDPNPYATTSVQKVCTPATVATGSQGAPIAVTAVELTPSPGKTRFAVRISNVGGGDVFRNGNQYLDKCSPFAQGLGFDEVDYVQVVSMTISDESIRESCKPLDDSQHVRLTNGQATLFCELSNVRGQTPYLTPLNIVLKYGYRQSIATQIEIRPLT